MAVALVVLVGAVALTSRQSAPSTIAEFAPQAVEQITDSLDDVAGAGRGASGEKSTLGDQTGVVDATRQMIDVARVRQCVGDPPRQIEDPQSPPCVPYWEGDNGGATSRGVTRDEIRVVASWYNTALHPALQAFFNKRFEFYGRKVRLIAREVAGGPAGERATARAVAEQDQAFGTASGHGGQYDYYDELTRLGVVGVHASPIFPEPFLDAHRPFVWTYRMANDRVFAMAGSWYCARFAGRNALHAGDFVLQQTRRKPGIVFTTTFAGNEGTSPESMNAQLKSCGPPAQVVTASGVFAASPASIENAVLQMKTSGVTTVVCLCYVWDLGFMMHAATNQGYFPEWLVTTYLFNDANNDIRVLVSSPEQASAMMALTVNPMQRPFAERPAMWATEEGTNTQYSAATRPGNDEADWEDAYRALLLLAAGIQMAGPNLTAATFERGLHRTRFPNPSHPIMAGAVGFTDGDHTMTDDAAEMWWSNTAQDPGPNAPVGAYCYVDHGARRRMGTFPSDDPFFQGECDSGIS